MFKTPSYWMKRTWISVLLMPFSWMLYVITYLRIRMIKPYHCGVPVICVGNVTAGGTGKTPIVIDILTRLQAKGHRISCITRGYGSGVTKKECVLVDKSKHTLMDVGDEALLLAQYAPTYVSPRRDVAARRAVEEGASILIMDDGLQHPYLYKDYSLMVIDGGFGLGNESLIPAGPLREPPAQALKRVDRVVMMGDGEVPQSIIKSEIPLSRGYMRPIPYGKISGVKAIAFAGIGRPEKFFQTAEKIGYELIATFPFPDHHPYTESQMTMLADYKKRQNIEVLTTRKDAMRLGAEVLEYITVIDVQVQWPASESPADDIIKKLL